MSATHQYYYPCKDLLSPEERKKLREYGGAVIKSVTETVKTDPNSRDIRREGYHGDQNLVSLGDDRITKQDRRTPWNETKLNTLVFNLNEPNPLFAIPAIEIAEADEMMEVITKRYNGHGWRFCASMNDYMAGPVHQDPKMGYRVNCNIPISPDYAFYRPTYFYRENDRDTLACSTNYANLRSPSLLNTSKWHSVGGGKGVVPKSEQKAGIYVGRSFAIQILYKETYPEVVKMFQKKGWLSTTPF